MTDQPPPPAEPVENDEPHRDHRDPGDRERLRGREPEWFKRLLQERGSR